MNSTEASLQADKKPAHKAQIAWIISAFVLVTLVLVLSPVARVLLYLFPAMAFVVAVITYVRSKPAYAALTCWLFLLTPLVRRLVDFRAGWIPATAVLAAPALACFAPLPFMLFNWRRLLRRAVPSLVALAGVGYGVFVAIILHNGFASIAIDLAYWLSPICFGMFVSFHSDSIESIYLALKNTLVASLLAMSAYGTYQYLFLPKWDAFWMENANLVSVGLPAPLQVRVFGTLNSPQAFAAFIVIGLFFAFQSTSKGRFISIPLGILTLALSGSRSAWLGFLIGLVYLFFRLPTRQRLQMASSAGLAMIFLLIALQTDARQSLFARFETLGNPSDDSSFISRYEGHAALLPKLATQPTGFGVGISSALDTKGGAGIGPGDSGLIALLLSLGIPGATIYLAALLIMSRSIVGNSTQLGVHVLRACVLALLSETLLTDNFQGQGGFILWMSFTLCLELWLAGRSRHMITVQRLAPILSPNQLSLN